MKNRIVLMVSFFVLLVIAYFFVIFLPAKEKLRLEKEVIKVNILKEEMRKKEESQKKCIPSGDDKNIQKVLKGKGAKAMLCKNAVFNLNKSINFTAPDQEIYTEGYSTDSARALLKIVNKDLSVAINANGQSNIKIKNIRVDGNRKGLGRLVSHGLIMVGGNGSGQEVDHVEAFDTRSWSTIHINWGDFYEDANGDKHSKCKGVKVTNNTIGPSGWAENGEWADGISVQCEGSLVANNIITDVTDGGIVVFGAPGSIIVNNTITAKNRPLVLGIGLVDYQYDGNYTGTTVSGNTINAENSFIRIGIGMGPSVWWCPTPEKKEINRGAIVTNNRLKGQYYGYGYAISGVENWVVEGNTSTANYGGVVKNNCGVINSRPAPFIINSNNSKGSFQNEFRASNSQKLNDILPNAFTWLPPYCSGSDFRGCNNLGYERCSNWGNSNYFHWNYELWKECKEACTNEDPNKFCINKNNIF